MKCILCNNKRYNKLYKINEYNIVRCTNCSFVFVTPLPTQKKLDKIYKNSNYETGFFYEGLIRSDARRTLNNLKKLEFKTKNLLDVGCGAGFFLDEARKEGWTTTGLDISTEAVDYAVNNLHLEVKRGNINTFSSQKNFDVIILIQVIEHLTKPYPVLKKIHSLLKKNGVVCIATPNINSWLSQVLKDRFNYLIPPEHIFYFSPSTLKQLLEKTGFQIIKTSSYGYLEDIESIYNYFREQFNKSNIIKKELVNNVSKSTDLKRFFIKDIVSRLTYPLLNISLHGSMIEIYAKKR